MTHYERWLSAFVIGMTVLLIDGWMEERERNPPPVKVDCQQRLEPNKGRVENVRADGKQRIYCGMV